MRTPQAPLASDKSAVGASGLEELWGRLDSLPTQAQPDEDGEYATGEALARARSLLAAAHEALRSMEQPDARISLVIASGGVTTDGRGGVRVEWWRGKHTRVHLIVAAEASLGDYVFFKCGARDPGQIDRDVQPAVLASRLHQLCTQPAEA